MKRLWILLLLPFLFGFTFNGKTIQTWDQKQIQTWNGKNAGAGVAAASSCDPANKEIGYRTYDGSYQTVGANSVFIERMKPDCSGELYQAAVWSYYLASEKIKVCIWTSSGTTPSSSDTLIACSSELTGATGWITGVSFPSGHNVDVDTYYWVGAWGATGGMDLGAGSGAGVYYKTGEGTYPDTPPSTLKDNYGTVSKSPLGAYITIH